MKTARTLAALGLGTLATVAALASPAVAQDTKAAPDKANQQCVVNTDNGDRACFATHREAIAYGTKGRVTDAPNDARAALKDEKLQERLSGPRSQHGIKPAKNAESAVAAESRVLATVYRDKDFGGGSVYFTGSQGCSFRYPWSATMGDDWNDAVSSTASGQCDITLYQHADHRGFSQTFRGNVPYVGDAMNDQASSYSFDR